jgi:large subunit ribosomal protein L13
MKNYVVDVKEENAPVGRIATKIADMLRGKNTPTFVANQVPAVRVTVKNANALEMSEKKLGEQYTHYTGYPGGLRMTSRGKVIEKKGHGEVIRRAVYGMLPKNKLRSLFMKNLVIEE